jgi:hypothetical protein
MFRVCSGCYSLNLSASQRMNAREWNDLVQVMASRGAIATDGEFDEISAYLARTFPRSSKHATPAAKYVAATRTCSLRTTPIPLLLILSMRLKRDYCMGCKMSFCTRQFNNSAA